MTPSQSKTQPLIEQQELSQLSPEKLVTGFTRTPVVRFAVIAVVLHVLVIVGTSVPFIYYTWINPEAAVARAAEVEAERKARQDAELRAKAGDDADADDDADDAEDDADPDAADDDPDAEGDDAATDRANGDSPIEQQLQEAAEPDEIPSLEDLLEDDETR